MGASGWSYFVEYDPHADAALRRLHERAFDAGDFYGSDEPNRPQSLGELLARRDEEGTHSILDIDHTMVAADPRVFPLRTPPYDDSLAPRVRHEADEVGVDYDEPELERRMAKERRRVSNWERRLAVRRETDDDYRKGFITDLLIEALLEHRGRLTVDNAEIVAEYGRHRERWTFRHPRALVQEMVITPEVGLAPPGDPEDPEVADLRPLVDDATRQHARAIHERASAASVDFEALGREQATKYFEVWQTLDPAWVGPEYCDAVSALAPGQVSAPIEAQCAIRIVKLLESRAPGTRPLMEVREEIRAGLRRTKLLLEGRDLRRKLLAAPDRPAGSVLQFPRPKAPPLGDLLGRAVAVTEHELECMFGTTQPGHAQVVELSDALGSELATQRWVGRYLTVFEGERPAEYYFFGYSGD